MLETLCLPAGEESIRQAAALLQAGRVVAFPTETVYGLGADALNEQAVRDIFAAKERPADNPLIVHVAERSQLEGLCRVTPTAETLMDAFWPGPLTLLLMKTEKVPDVTTAGLPSVAVRCPSHPVAHALLRVCGIPIAAPSANRSGRPGAITAEDVASVVGSCTVAPSVMRPLKEGESAPSPGMKHRHYAPKAKMTVYIGSDEAVADAIIKRYDETENAVILAHDSALPLFGDRRAFSLGETPQEGAHLLFRRLREMDALNVSLILAQGWKPEGEALAVMNRMARAAAFDLVVV